MKFMISKPIDEESSETIRRTCKERRMIWSDLRGDTESQAETPWPLLRKQAGGVTNVNGPKVAKFLVG